MTSPHNIDVTIRHGAVDTRFSCTAVEGAPCRLVCTQGCESWTSDHEQDMRESYLIVGVPEGEADAKAAMHRLTDNGMCNLLEFIENDEAELYELYEGNKAPFRSGPVELSYQDEYVSWAYAKEES